MNEKRASICGKIKVFKVLTIPNKGALYEYCKHLSLRRLVLSANMRKQRIDTVRLKLLKIAAKVVHSARYITFKLCSSCPYKEEFYDTLSAIGKLNVQLE